MGSHGIGQGSRRYGKIWKEHEEGNDSLCLLLPSLPVHSREAFVLDPLHFHQRAGWSLHQLRLQVPAPREEEKKTLPGVRRGREEFEEGTLVGHSLRRMRRRR